ncbi:MAG: hypothetical protein ACREA0_04915 [bacterium]
MKRHTRRLPVLGMTMAALTLAAAAPATVGAAEFSEAELYFELNDTDGDLGIHSSIDGGAYSRLTITDPKDQTILKIRPRGRLARQGLTQLFFESAEPKFAELDPATFFRRFPEGAYGIRARSLEGEVLQATVALSQVLAAPVANITVSGVPAASNCDAVPLPSVSEPVLIDWDPVTESHPTIGKSGPVEIVEYQFFVEREGVKLSVELPPTVTEFQVPSDVIALGNEFKFEIIARTASNNNTAIESCFTVQ